MNAKRNVLVLMLILAALAFAPAVTATSAPVSDTSDLLVAAPLDVELAAHLAEPIGPRRGHLVLLLLPPALFVLTAWGRRRTGWAAAGVLLVCAGTLWAGDPHEDRFLWDQATAQMTRARSPDEFIRAAHTYRQLIANGVRNRHVFYNLGTAWLKAGRPQRALDALERAERYAGTAPDIRHNMAIARHALDLSVDGERPLWQRLLLFWHFTLQTGHRVTVALWAYAALWFGLILRGGSHRRLAGTLLALSLPVALLFGTSAAASLLAERDARRSDQRGIRNQEGAWQGIDPYPVPRTATPASRSQDLHFAPTSRSPHPDAPRLPHPLAPTNEAPPLVATLDLSPAHPYLYETFTVTLTLRATGIRLGQSLDIEGLPPPDVLHREPFRELPSERDATGDKVVDIRRYRLRARAPTVDLPPLQLDVLVSAIDPERDYAPEEETLYRLTTGPVPLSIRPLPQAERPDGFSGAVGQFTFDAALDRTRVLAREPVTLVMHLQGEGDLSDIVPPGLRHVTGCRLAPPARMPGQTSESRVYRQSIVPQGTNLPALPAVTFSFFDPKAERYETHSAGPFTLHFDRPPRQARFAPSHEAAVSFALPPGVTPTVLGSMEGWIKVQVGRRIGWFSDRPR